MIKQRKTYGPGLLAYQRKFERIRHLPRALQYANDRAERWRQRYLTACKERDEAQAVIERASELYKNYMKWNGDPDSEFSSSPLQRRQLAEALGIEQ